MKQRMQRRAQAIFLTPFFIAEPLSRAIFVAALALAAFALFRYWQSLNGIGRHLRWLLIALRGLAFLLLASALAGVRFEYEAATGARVLLSRKPAFDTRTKAPAEALRGGEQSAQGIISLLKNRAFTVVEKGETGDALTNEAGETYAAGVLLTDGAMKANEAALEVNRLSAATGGAPVFVVINQPAAGVPGVALESLTITSRPVRGVPLTVRCAVHGRGMRGRESLVTIADEAKVQASASVKWTNDDERQTVALSIVPKVAGRTNYTARIEAAGGEDANTLARPLTIYVEERRWSVLFIEGEPTWEAKFIRRALERSQLFEVDYFAQVSRAAAIGLSEKAIEREEREAIEQDATVESKGAAVNPPEARLRNVLSSAERLNTYDCIIIGATPNEMLSAAETARLSIWTERRGGGLVILGGNSFAGSIAAPNGKLYTLLPAAIDPRGFASESQQLARSAPLEVPKNREGVALLPTASGAGAALSAYLNAFQGTASKADVLTGQGLRLGQLRPGASALAVAGRGSAVATSEAGAPLIAAARYGAGRTLVFAPADSWRLRTTSGEQDETDAPYNALWQGLILWATAGAKPHAEIILSDESPVAGQDLTAEIRVRDALFAPAKIEKLNARLQPLTEDTTEPATGYATPREIAFVPDESDESVWRAALPISTPGQYVLEASYVANGRGGSLNRDFTVVASLSTEPGTALDTLSRAARETGGGLLTNNDASALSERLAAMPRNQTRTRHTWELRTWWPLAFILPLLLSTAWLIERIKAER